MNVFDHVFKSLLKHSFSTLTSRCERTPTSAVELTVDPSAGSSSMFQTILGDSGP